MLREKIYYQILNNPYGCALEYKKAYTPKVECEKMVANEYIIGTHDFQPLVTVE